MNLGICLVDDMVILRNPSDWLGVQQASEYLNVARSTLYNWKCQGRLTAYKLGSRLLFCKSELDSLVRSGCVEAINV